MIFRRQRAEVARLAQQVAGSRDAVRQAQADLGRKARGAIGSPGGLLGCFIAGWVAPGLLRRLVRRARADGHLPGPGLAAVAAWALAAGRAAYRGGVRDTTRPTEAPGSASPASTARR